MAEVHPFPTPFYFAAGIFAGNRTFLHFRNTNDGALQALYDANQKVQDYNTLFRTNYPPVGLKFGDYVFTADEYYNIDVKMRTWAVKPYLGIGFGRPVSKTGKLVSCAFDMGVQFWGKPKLEAWAPDDNKWAEVKKEHIDDEDFQDAYDIVRKICVYPVLNFRLFFNCF